MSDGPEAEGVYWNRPNPPGALTLPPIQLVSWAESAENVSVERRRQRTVRVHPRALGSDAHRPHRVLLLVGQHREPRLPPGGPGGRRRRRRAGEVPGGRGLPRVGALLERGRAAPSRAVREGAPGGDRLLGQGQRRVLRRPRHRRRRPSRRPISKGTAKHLARKETLDGYRQLWAEQPEREVAARSPASCACSRSCASSSRRSARSASSTRRCTPASPCTGSGWRPSRA